MRPLDFPIHMSFPQFSFCQKSWWEKGPGWILEVVEKEYQAASASAFQENLIFPEQEAQIQILLRVLGISSYFQEKFLPESFFASAVALSSTQRLFGLAQVNPAVNSLLGIALNRGRHTLDCMELTARVFIQEAALNPFLFDELTQNYQVKRDQGEPLSIQDQDLSRRIKVVLHFIEYMRLHDLFTLAFQGATHGLLFKGEPYDEDEVLLGVLRRDHRYDQIACLYENPETREFYQRFGLQEKIIRQIAEEALLGSLGLAQILKGKKGEERILSLDTTAYIIRGASELGRVFLSETNPSPLQKIQATYQKAFNLACALQEGGSLELSRQPFSLPFDELIRNPLVRLQLFRGEPVFVFDSLSVYHLYLAHLASRLYWSGSPWVRGINTLIRASFKPLAEETIILLATSTEEELIFREKSLQWLSPVFDLSPESLATPDLLPPFLTGWRYSSQSTGGLPERFVLKDTSATLVQTFEGEILSLSQAFPHLVAAIEKINNQTQRQLLYLSKVK